MKNAKKDSNCGGYQKPKGKLDTQMYPECEGTPLDRDIVKKTREKRKKNKRLKKKESSMNTIYQTKKAKKKQKNETPYNPYAVCTESIGEKEGTTERSKWSDDAKKRYDKCIKDVKKQNTKSKKKSSNQLKTIKLSKKEWEKIGKKAGWNPKRTRKEIVYKEAPYGYIATIPAGVSVEPADNLPQGGYWVQPWEGMTEKEEAWHRNYGFHVDEDQVE